MADDGPYTITDAADRAGVARSTIRRALDRGDFPNAARDADDPRGTWLIPADDLDGAGYSADRGTTQGAPDADGGVDRGVDGGVQQGAAMVPLDTFRELFQHIANAEARAAKAEAELAFLRERMAAREGDEDDEEESVWDRMEGYLIAVLSLTATVGAVMVGTAFALAPEPGQVDRGAMIGGTAGILFAAVAFLVLYVRKALRETRDR